MKFLPGANFERPTQVGGSGRLPASEINRLANEPRELTATVVARGAIAPLLYGRRAVPGLIFAHGKLGTSLVIGYIWCLGEADAVEAIYLNDEAIPAGVAVTTYLGTPTQGVDPDMAAAVAAYSDSMRYTLPGGARLGVCYSVIKIPPGKLGGFPRARAVVRGRKVLDPRTSVVAFSSNPALHLNDLITNPDFGLGGEVSGVDACANWADSLLGGVAGAPRARSALYLAQGRKAEDYVDLLCEYAECLRVYEGSTIKLIPDAPVDLTTAKIITPSDIVAGSFSLSAESSIDTPTEVEFQYTQEPAIAEQNWALEPVITRLPGVSEGEVQRVPTSVTLDGVYRNVEATNKGLARLNRMQNRINVTWTSLDIGIVHQRGDVVRLRLAARGVDIDVRIEDVKMAAYGRYIISATRYDANHYPSDAVLPGGDGLVPEGAIAMLVGDTVPPGWALFTAADGRYIVGAGGVLLPADIGGDSNVPSWTFTTTPGGAHQGIADIPYPKYGTTGGGNHIIEQGGQPDHTHETTIAAFTPKILSRENRLIIKVGGSDVLLPPEARVFGLQNTNTPANKIIAFAGRYLQAAAVNADAGESTETKGIGSTSVPGHVHIYNYGPGTEAYSTGPSPSSGSFVASAPHSHAGTATITYNLKRQQLCAFGNATPFSIRAGMIFMWAGVLGSLPADYVLCDGNNGSPDMRDRFAQLAGASPEPPAGDNTSKLTAAYNSVGHSHAYGSSSGPGYDRANHGYTDYHSHAAISSRSFTPAFYALAFIMYAPTGI